jgi:hypothetical protein
MCFRSFCGVRGRGLRFDDAGYSASASASGMHMCGYTRFTDPLELKHTVDERLHGRYRCRCFVAADEKRDENGYKVDHDRTVNHI